MADDGTISLYRVDRLCKPDIDVSQLTLTSQVDRSESVYTSKYVKLSNASLPGAALVDEGEAELFDWDLFLVLKYEQKWTPAGYGLGELLYTISLLPDEELTLELKTWETSKTQQDREETVDQRNVSDIKDSISTSSDVSESREMTTNTSVNGKASYSGFGFSASIEAGWSENVKDMQAQSAKETRDRSQQATNEYKSSHKVRLAVSREEGSESKTTRKIKNINQTRTLNVNYYEVLKTFDVSLALSGVPLAMLGPEADLAADIVVDGAQVPSNISIMMKPASSTPDPSQPKFGFPTYVGDRDRAADSVIYDPNPSTPPQPVPETLTLGRLIRYSQSQHWVAAFIDYNGFSPIKLLYELWSEQLFMGAVPPGHVFGSQSTISQEDRTRFRDAILRFVRPISGWVASDEKGAIRWGYEVVDGQETKFLDYLYSLLPFSASELKAQVTQGGVDASTAAELVADRFAAVSERSAAQKGTRLTKARRISRKAPGVEPPRPSGKTLAAEGPFKGKTIEQFAAELPDWIRDIQATLVDLRDVKNPVASWKATLPTQGVYSDLTLGVCSGAEDYYEIQRQFDLESRKLEVEKLKLQIEKLRLENQRLQAGEPSIIIGSDASETSLKLNITAGEQAPSVKVQSPGP
ncbi:hypothetical protein WMF28_14930 [Sorangium sp. So ce590]|uniref:hypothetical protein n=1 Tax=Sorangium sp. So ce590 TaxID=3133317 RepID=UPI003F5E065B